jgi:hypothetical protein
MKSRGLVRGMAYGCTYLVTLAASLGCTEYEGWESKKASPMGLILIRTLTAEPK